MDSPTSETRVLFCSSCTPSPCTRKSASIERGTHALVFHNYSGVLFASGGRMNRPPSEIHIQKNEADKSRRVNDEILFFSFFPVQNKRQPFLYVAHRSPSFQQKTPSPPAAASYSLAPSSNPPSTPLTEDQRVAKRVILLILFARSLATLVKGNERPASWTALSPHPSPPPRPGENFVYRACHRPPWQRSRRRDLLKTKHD